MIFKEAIINDIAEMQIVRHTVKENILSNPALVTDKDCEEYITIRGKGWVCLIDGIMAGFAIVDLKEHSVWALFLRPEFEGKGIGKQLQQLMLDWYFTQSSETVWLTTAADTRAEAFYKSFGWKETIRYECRSSTPGFPSFTEIKLEMRKEDWKR